MTADLRPAEVKGYLENLHEAVSRTRAARRLTLQQAADQMHVAVSWLWKLERGEGNPGLTNTLRILDWLENDL